MPMLYGFSHTRFVESRRRVALLRIGERKGLDDLAALTLVMARSGRSLYPDYFGDPQKVTGVVDPSTRSAATCFTTNNRGSHRHIYTSPPNRPISYHVSIAVRELR